MTWLPGKQVHPRRLEQSREELGPRAPALPLPQLGSGLSCALGTMSRDHCLVCGWGKEGDVARDTALASHFLGVDVSSLLQGPHLGPQGLPPRPLPRVRPSLGPSDCRDDISCPPNPQADFRVSHLRTEVLLGPQNPFPALLSLQVWSKGGVDVLMQGFGVPGLVCRVEGLPPFSSSPLLFLGEGKRRSHKTQSSEKMGSPGRTWRPPAAPDHIPMRQEPGPRAQDTGQAQ